MQPIKVCYRYEGVPIRATMIAVVPSERFGAVALLQTGDTFNPFTAVPVDELELDELYAEEQTQQELKPHEQRNMRKTLKVLDFARIGLDNMLLMRDPVSMRRQAQFIIDRLDSLME